MVVSPVMGIRIASSSKEGISMNPPGRMFVPEHSTSPVRHVTIEKSPVVAIFLGQGRGIFST